MAARGVGRMMIPSPSDNEQGACNENEKMGFRHSVVRQVDSEGWSEERFRV